MLPTIPYCFLVPMFFPRTVFLFLFCSSSQKNICEELKYYLSILVLFLPSTHSIKTFISIIQKIFPKVINKFSLLESYSSYLTSYYMKLQQGWSLSYIRRLSFLYFCDNLLSYFCPTSKVSPFKYLLLSSPLN